MQSDTLRTIAKLDNFFDSKFSVPGNWYFMDYNQSPIKIWSAIFPEDSRSITSRHYFGTAGKSLCRYQAYLSAAAERIERYSLTIRDADYKDFSINEKPSDIDVLDINALREAQGLLEFQYSSVFPPIEKLDEKCVLRWIKGKYLDCATDVWIPEEISWLKSHTDQRYFMTSTNGCAAHITYEKALVNAIFELIERDSFLFCWWKKIRLKKIAYRNFLSENNPQIYRAYGPWIHNVEVFLLDSGFQVPAFAAVFHTEQEGLPAFLLATAAASTPQIALEKCLLELAGMINFHVCFDTDELRGQQLFIDFDAYIKSFSSHAQYYTNLKNAKQVYFYDQLSSIDDLEFCEVVELYKDISDLKNENEVIQILKQRFVTLGLKPIIVDQTSKDVKDLGFFVVRCIDPGIIDLDSYHKYRRWGKSRLGINLGNINQINHMPHPIP